MTDLSDHPEALAAGSPPPTLERARRSVPVDELALTALYEAHRAEIQGFSFA